MSTGSLTHACLPYPIRGYAFALNIETFLAGIPANATTPKACINKDEGTQTGTTNDPVVVDSTVKPSGALRLSLTGTETTATIINGLAYDNDGSPTIDNRQFTLYPQD